MEELRKPFFIVALVLAALVVLLELGAAAFLEGRTPSAADLSALIPLDDPEVRAAFAELDAEQRAELQEIARSDKPPGFAIPYLALIDGLLLFTVGLLGASLLIPEGVQGRVQGVVTLVVTILVILAGIILAIIALLLLILMVALLFAAPFGTLAYLAKFGFFDRGGASLLLGLILALKVGFVVCLLLAQQRFVQNRGLVLLILTSFVAMLIVGFLHGFVPLFLVSITDAIAAIILAIIAIIWAIVLLVFSLSSIIRAVRPEQI